MLRPSMPLPNAFPGSLQTWLLSSTGSAVQWHWQTPAGLHYHLGSVFSVDSPTLQLGVGPQIGPQVLQ
jgi:hypothetical protein